jgi:hypothetical protein
LMPKMTSGFSGFSIISFFFQASFYKKGCTS